MWQIQSVLLVGMALVLMCMTEIKLIGVSKHCICTYKPLLSLLYSFKTIHKQQHGVGCLSCKGECGVCGCRTHTYQAI